MNDISKSIQYAKWSWNPLSGCLHNCQYCYARRIANRFEPKRESMGMYVRDGIYMAPPKVAFPAGWEPTWYEHRLEEPTKKRKPSIIFVGDMCDLWGDWVPRWAQEAVLDTCGAAFQHVFLTLTKAPEGMLAFTREHPACNPWPPNLWRGVTAEDQEAADTRLPLVLQLGGPTWVSLEPLLGPLDLTSYLARCSACRTYVGQGHAGGWRWTGEGWEHKCAGGHGQAGHFPATHGLAWVVVGAQTGPGAVPPRRQWLLSIRQQCQAAGVPLYEKSNLAWCGLGDLVQQWPAQMQGHLPASAGAKP